MLRSMNDLKDYAILATDGDIGKVRDFYFDDHAWVIRYLIVETGTWLSSREVLISPISIDHPNWKGKVLPVSITKKQVQNSPKIDTNKPVSRQHEMEYLGYYGYPQYWGGSGLWAGGVYPTMMVPEAYAGSVSTSHAGQSDAAQSAAVKVRAHTEAARHDQDDDPHLRSCKAVIDYDIHATDGDIGHVTDMLVDDETWAVRYFIVNTSNWWVGHRVLVAPQWIRDVIWHDSKVTVTMTRQAIKDAPPYDSTAKFDRGQEMGIYKHYGRPGYWADETKNKVSASRTF